jgi:hypothetical protein
MKPTQSNLQPKCQIRNPTIGENGYPFSIVGLRMAALEQMSVAGGLGEA